MEIVNNNDNIEYKETLFKYEKGDIPQELVDQCNEMSIIRNETFFIFDSSLSKKVRLNLSTREEKLDFLSGDYDEELDGYKDLYHIGNEECFHGLPSRFSYYDTETKLFCRYQKIDLVVNLLNNIGFISSSSNFGAEYEQSFFIENGFNKKIIVRLQPNLFIKIIDIFLNKTIYNGFFNSKKILNILLLSKSVPKSMVRSIKLEQIKRDL